MVRPSQGRFSEHLEPHSSEADGFEGMPDLAELKEQFSAFLTFYREAKSEQRRLDLSDLPELAFEIGVSPLEPNQRVLLWDAVAENLWIRKSKPTVDVIRAIFIADLVLNGLEDITQEELSSQKVQTDLRRMLNAQLVLPLPLDNRSKQRRHGVINERQRELLEAAHDRIIAGIDKRRLSSAQDELYLAKLRLRAETLSRNDSLEVETERGAGETSTINRLAVHSEQPDNSNGPRTVSSSFFEGNDISKVMAHIASPSVKATLAPFQARAFTTRDLEDSLDEEIEINELIAGGEPEVAQYAAFYAFGTEFAIEEHIPKGSLILKRCAHPDGGYLTYMTYYHGRTAPVLIELSGQIVTPNGRTRLQPIFLETGDDRFQTLQLTTEPEDGLFSDVELALRTAAPGAPLANLDTVRILNQVPHFDVPDLTEAPVLSQQPQPLFGINRLGLIEYRRVEQETACYVSGEVSRIESIPARTFKRRNTRTFAMTELEQDVTQEISSERQSETEAVEKREMQSQVQETLREEQGKSFDFGTGVSVELPGAGSLTTETGFNFNSQSSKEDATTQSIQLARQITQKVAEKIVQKTTARRRSLSRKEFEDIVEQGFDNRMGDDHVICVHRSVDKIVNNTLVNYGRMEVIEFEVPEPARHFISAQQSEREEQQFTHRRPKRPRSIGLRGPKSINFGNYRRFAKTYGIDLDAPPQRKVKLAQAYADSMPLMGGDEEISSPNRAVAWNDLTVPEGYVATTVWVEAVSEDALRVDGNPFSGGGDISISVGNTDFLKSSAFVVQDLNNLEGTVPVSVMARGAGAFTVQVTIECKLKPRHFFDWQMKSFTKLMEAYRKQKAEYDEALAAHKSEVEEAETRESDLNPRFRRQVMERELKRLCISMIADQLEIDITANHYGGAPEGDLPPINFGPSLDKHAELVRFLEQAVHWNLMSYMFYPYFYADKERWREKLSMEATRDRLFAAFLSSGMGRVVVPIRPEFASAFGYFLETGIPWFGEGLVMDSQDDHYLSLADEIMTGNHDEIIEDRWQTKLPTNLTILQDAASAMIGEGLPCEIDENRIGAGNSRLSPVLPPVEGDGSVE